MRKRIRNRRENDEKERDGREMSVCVGLIITDRLIVFDYY